jgi:Spy/CpxP family protein refolding chaperone
MGKVRILALMALTVGAIFAQAPRPPLATQYWWRNSVTVKSLDLSDAQTKQLNQIQQSYVSRLMDLQTAVNNADRNLEEVFRQATIDDLKAETARDQYANARDNMTRELTEMSLKMRRVLTAEQWGQLESMQNGRGGGRGGQGRGRRGPPTSGTNTTSNKVGPAISQQK